MPKILLANYWFPEALASRWTKLPTRMSYSVDPVPAEVTRTYWESQAAGEVRLMTLGVIPNTKRIDSALIDKVISFDRSAFVVTGGTVIHVIVNQDLLQLYDSTYSWWVEMWVVGGGGREFGYGSRVKFSQ